MTTINCPRCEEPVHGLSDEELIYATDHNGQNHIIPKGEGSQYCRDNRLNMDWTEMPKDDVRRIPLGVCKKCAKELKKHTKIVEDGGLMFQCLECNATGVILGSETTLDVKHKMGFASDDLVGVEFNACVEHNGEEYSADVQPDIPE